MERLKILIADDEEKIVRLVSDFLSNSGYETITALDGKKALDIFREEKENLSLAIIDIMMPEIDGWALTKEIRNTSDLPIIMLSARAEEFDLLTGFEAGIDEYVTKPFSPAVLVKRVDALIRRNSGKAMSVPEEKGLVIDEAAYLAFIDGKELELSRYESGQIPLNKHNFDVSVIARDMGKRITAGKNILFENQIPADTFVYADQLQIEQVLKSLLENAVSHTPENGEIRISITEEDGIYKISVFNSGNQIPSEIMPQIWQSFFRGDKSHKRDSSRFGLGLSIVSAIMKMHGRNCGVNNAENGVKFWFEVEKTRDI